MNIQIVPMTEAYAYEISTWEYPRPYDIYNINSEANAMSELMNGSYYAVEIFNNRLIGYYCFGESAIVSTGHQFKAYEDQSYLDIGIGLNPDLCGAGNGKSFFCELIDFAKRQFDVYKLRLTVASFNQRAIHLYESFGFKESIRFSRVSEHNQIEFMIMIYNDFDRIIDRSRQASIKHDELQNRFGKSDLYAMWVADMDFEVAPAISDALINRANDKIYGYTARPQTYFEAVVNWFNKKHALNLKPEHLLHSPGAVTSINVAVNAFTKPNDKIIIQTPVYHPFYEAISKNDRIILENELIKKENDYEMDFESLEILAEEATLLILCNPHNPVGRVWRKEELIKLDEICTRHNVRIISDEIHCDLVFKPHQHTSMMNVSKNPVITFISATKTFNLAGLQASFIICTDSEDQHKMNHFFRIYDIMLNNAFSLVAVESAFKNGEKWLNTMLEYVHDNLLYVKSYCEAYIPECIPNMPEGTYLQWIDCRGLGLNAEALNHFFIHEAGIAINNGILFGEKGSGYIRLNVACSRNTLREVLKSLENAVIKIRN